MESDMLVQILLNQEKEKAMIGILYFYSKSCQYCKRADSILLELQNGNADYAKVEVLKIDEEARPDIVSKFPHDRVPAFFLGDRKLYEATPTESRAEMKQNIEKVLKVAGEIEKMAESKVEFSRSLGAVKIPRGFDFSL